MKYILFALLSISLMACASKRDPASLEEQQDVSKGVNTDYYPVR